MDFQTPGWVCRYMVGMVPPWAKTALEPTPGEGNVVRALEAKGLVVTAPSEFWDLPPGHWDVVAMNPPFSPPTLGYKFLFRCMEMSEVVIAILPWLVIINGERRTKMLFEWGLKSVTHLPRRVFKGSRVQCCILELNKGYKGEVFLRRIGDEEEKQEG